MTKDDYIRLMSSKSGDRLLKMMDFYNVHGLKDLTLDQVKDFYEKTKEK